MAEPPYPLHPIGIVRSPLARREDAPRQGRYGAPAAWLEIDEAYRAGLQGMEPGREIVVITWLHLSERDILQVHPRGDDDAPMRGVFTTRAPVRPNPLGIHPVTVLEVDGLRLKVEPLEAVDGTPIIDIKAAYPPPDGSEASPQNEPPPASVP